MEVHPTSGTARVPQGTLILTATAQSQMEVLKFSGEGSGTSPEFLLPHHEPHAALPFSSDRWGGGRWATRAGMLEDAKKPWQGLDPGAEHRRTPGALKASAGDAQSNSLLVSPEVVDTVIVNLLGGPKTSLSIW